MIIVKHWPIFFIFFKKLFFFKRICFKHTFIHAIIPCNNSILEISCINGNTLARDKHLQNNRNRSQKFSVASKLFAIIHLFPPCQCVIHPLVIRKRSPLLPVEKVVCDLKQIFNEASNRNGKDSGWSQDQEKYILHCYKKNRNVFYCNLTLLRKSKCNSNVILNF